MEIGYTFSDMSFEPQYSEVPSRSDVTLNTKLGKIFLQLPVISANMGDITGKKMALEMRSNGGLGILHRFMSVEENIKEYVGAVNELGNSNQYIGVSVGVGKSGRERFDSLYHLAGARTFCIDVAHGHHVHVKDMLTYIHEGYDLKDVTLIAGNVATVRGAEDLFSWGADVVKVGVGPGAVCQTRQNTGAGVPQLYALAQIRKALPEFDLYPTIADGGIKFTSDIAKALVYANAVMVGSFISGTTETPGSVYENEKGEFYKVYGGSASGERKVKAGGENSFVEGMVKTVPFRGHVKYILKKIRENVQSSCSYQGAFNLDEFRVKAVLKPITEASRVESKI